MSNPSPNRRKDIEDVDRRMSREDMQDIDYLYDQNLDIIQSTIRVVVALKKCK